METANESNQTAANLGLARSEGKGRSNYVDKYGNTEGGSPLLTGCRAELSLSTDIHAVEMALAERSGALERLKRHQI